MSAAPDEIFGLLRDLEAKAEGKPRIGRSLRAVDDVARFGQTPHVHFATASADAPTDAAPGAPPRIGVYFMGLLGPMGPMPFHLTEIALFERRYAKDRSFGEFLDVLNNRMVQLFYRAWADADPMAHRDKPEDDRFYVYAATLAALTGAGGRLPDGAARALVGFAGQVAGRRSPAAIADVAAAALGVAAEIEEFVGRWNAIDPADATAIGRAGRHNALGKDAVAGTRVYSVQDAAKIRLSFATLARFEERLPDAPGFALVLSTLSSLMPASLDWTAEYELPESEARPLELGRYGKLGWTSWLSPKRGSDARRRDVRIAPGRSHGRSAALS